MSKVLVFCIDALCASDVARMRRMPHFAQLLERGALVEKIEPVLPALTYTCHTSILTGTYAGRHGIVHNEKMTRGGHLDAPWYCMKSDVRGKTLLDIARENGLTTCSLSWPVSGGADYTMNMPMIVPYSYQGYQPQQWLEHTATANLMDRYFYKHGRYLMGPTRSLDLFTMALALDILEDGPQPDIMLVKLCDLDSARGTPTAWKVSRPRRSCACTMSSSALFWNACAARARWTRRTSSSSATTARPISAMPS